MYPPRNAWEKGLFGISWATVGVWWALLITIGLMAYDRDPPIIDLQGRFAGWSEHNPRIGIVEWTGKRMRSCDGWSYRQVVNGHVIDLSPIKITSYPIAPENVGKEEKWIVEFELPRAFDHDGHYRIRAEYYCNAFHRSVWPIVLTPADVPFQLPPRVAEYPLP